MSVRGSLRLKITLWFVVTFTLVQILLVLAIVALRQDSIQAAADAEFEKDAAAMVDNLLVAQPDWTREALEELVPSGAGFVLVCIRDETGRSLIHTGFERPADLPFSEWEQVPAGPVGPVLSTVGPERAELLLGEDRSLRLVTVPFRLAGESLYYLQAALPEQELDRSVGPFRDLFLIGVPIGVTAALASAWLIAGRAVRPMVHMSQVAQGVSPETLSSGIRVESKDAEVTDLQERWNQALRRLQEAFTSQDRFLGTVSHELMTPVSVLLAEAQQLERGRPTKKDFQDYVRSAQEELRRIGNLVESFLALSRVEHARHPIELETCAVNDLVLEALQHSSSLAKMHEVHLVPMLPEPDEADSREPIVRGHPALLRSLFENLIRNAVRFSPAEGTVRVTVRAEGDEVSVEVRDEGPGIPPHRLEAVFERFYSAAGASGGDQSTGLGLSIAKDVVDLHEGSIEAFNHEDQGCSFIVLLPLEGPSSRS